MAHVDRKGVRDFLAANGGGKLMAKVLAKFGATSTIERDVDKNHGPAAPSMEATPTDSMSKTRSQAIYDRRACCFQQSLCRWRESSFSPVHSVSWGLSLHVKK